jgi:hypothetical protein
MAIKSKTPLPPNEGGTLPAQSVPDPLPPTHFQTTTEPNPPPPEIATMSSSIVDILIVLAVILIALFAIGKRGGRSCKHVHRQAPSSPDCPLGSMV